MVGHATDQPAARWVALLQGGFDTGRIGQVTSMIRRMLRQVGSVAVASWMWKHRGSVLRTSDLAMRAPQIVRTGRTADLPVEAKAILALDRTHATDASVRITGINDGSVTLRDLGGTELEAARSSLCSVREVADVQTQPTDQPTFDDALSAAGR